MKKQKKKAVADKETPTQKIESLQELVDFWANTLHTWEGSRTTKQTQKQ